MHIAALVVIAAIASLGSHGPSLSFTEAHAVQASDPAVFVVGFIRKPGKYRLEPGMTVGEVIERAGGPTRDGAVRIRRMVDGQLTEIAVAYADLVQPNDTVVVGTR